MKLLNTSIVKKFLVTILTSLLFLSSIATSADGPTVQQQSPNAPAETAQFGQLVGSWTVRDYGLSQDGKWQEGSGADWNFYWVLGGTAIQDDWISPSLDKSVDDKKRQMGTNIRIYNPKKKRWEMAWMANTGAKVDTFTATADKDNIVMRGNYAGSETRITFHNISKKHFSWKMETQDKESSLWKEVYRIEAEKVAKK